MHCWKTLENLWERKTNTAQKSTLLKFHLIVNLTALESRVSSSDGHRLYLEFARTSCSYLIQKSRLKKMKRNYGQQHINHMRSEQIDCKEFLGFTMPLRSESKQESASAVLMFTLYSSEQMIRNCTYLLPNTRLTHTVNIHCDDNVLKFLTIWNQQYKKSRVFIRIFFTYQ